MSLEKLTPCPRKMSPGPDLKVSPACSSGLGHHHQASGSADPGARPHSPGGQPIRKPGGNSKAFSRLKKSVRVISCLTRLTSVSPSTAFEKWKVTIWPEWNDAEVNTEKWDTSGQAKGKEDKKGKSPVMPSAFFEDPDGKLDLPASLRVDHWKRPHDFMADEKPPVVVDVDHMNDHFDLVTNNSHLLSSEFLRCFISQVTILWELGTDNNAASRSGQPETSMVDDLSAALHAWNPWEHIYSLNKVVKHHIPLYNPYGKYLVRIYWMGCWRKIPVDDLLPLDEHDQLLLPVTGLSHELWPMLLAKALIKVASLDYSGGNPSQEFGDMLILHNLTGWLPEAIPLHTPASYTAGQVLDVYYRLLKTRNVPMNDAKELRHSHHNETWELLKALLPEWSLPEPPDQQKQEDASEDPNNLTAACSESPSKELMDPTFASSPNVSIYYKEGRPAISKVKSKDGVDKKKKEPRDEKKDKKDKDKDKDKDKKDKAVVEELPVIPEKPEVVVFAMFGGLGKPVKISQLARMADASERLRQNGLSHQYPHPVCVTQTRSCSLDPPPPPEVVPAWKLIRPRKKKERPTDEPKVEEEPPKDIQCVEITSPFVNYVNPVPIPTSTMRTISCLERGQTRSWNAMSIQETEEFVLEQEALQEEPPLTLPTENEDIPPLPEVPEEETTEDIEDVKVKKNSQHKPRSAKKDKNSDHAAENQSASGKGGKADRSNTKGKSAKKTDSRTTRKEDTEDKKDKGKADKEESPPEIIEEDLEGEAAQSEEGSSETAKNTTQWIDFEQFCICFRTLYIFHKPATYLCNQRYSDLKNITLCTPAPPVKGDKKQPASVTGNTGQEDKSSHFLFVDSLKPSEIVVSFSVLPRWFDPPPVVMEEKKSSGSKGGKDKEGDKDTCPVNSVSSIQDNVSTVSPREQGALPPMVSPGTLVAEPYSWKSLVTGQPILRLRTTGIRAAVLSLPPGRHVLKFIMTSPIAHHIHMCSTVPIVFGDEETVMPCLVHESCRFKDSSLQIMTALGKCISSFCDSLQSAEARQQLQILLCPPGVSKSVPQRQHSQHFAEALYSMLRRALRDVATPDMALAWRAFRHDVASPNILGLPLGPRPDSSSGEKGDKAEKGDKETPAAGGRGSGKQGSKKQVDSKQSSEPEKTESTWTSKYLEPSPEEHVAAIKILKAWRGYWVRKVLRAGIPGMEESTKAQEQLQKSWAVLEPSAEENGLFLFRELFKKNPDIMQFYPFYNDEWNRVSYADYRGSFPDQLPNIWFLLFREVFYAKEETMMMPKIYVPIPTCMLRVVDNDTGHQLPTVFQKVAPYVYKQNKKGYTFIAEARTLDQPLAGGTWRMRLIGSFSALPSPRTQDSVNSSFSTKEIQDYYLPGPKNILFRYCVKMTEDQVVSLQVCTSREDVYLRLCVLDHEEEVASATGKSHVVIPAFIFQKDVLAPTDDALSTNPSGIEVRMSSKGSVRVGSSKGPRVKKTNSAKSQEDKASRESPISDPAVNEAVEEKIHKYIVQATVLKNSWPLSEEDLPFVNKLKEEEKNELKGGGASDRQTPPPKADKLTVNQKGKSRSKTKEKEPSTVIPPTNIIDPDKPSWILRLVIDAAAAEDMEVKKDTERTDEIRAVKKAWEEADPGRAQKAYRSRQKYLSSRAVKQSTREETMRQDIPSPSPLPDIPVKIDVSMGEGIVSSGLHPTSTSSKKTLPPLDFSSFYRGSEGQAVYMDETQEQRMVEERQRLITEFKAQRQEVEQWRAQDRVDRNLTKIRQLEDAQELQANVDEKREMVNVPREAFRQVYLEAEWKRQEELAQQEALLKLEMEAKAEKTKKNAKGKKKK